MPAPMVRAILKGTKSQTRRILKPQGAVLTDDMAPALGVRPPATQNPPVIPCPYGAANDTLWVKETWRTDLMWDTFAPVLVPEKQPIKYEADDECTGVVAFKWGRIRQSIFMRRWMSRITLEIVSVRVERLQDISEADAVAEGGAPTYSPAGYNITTDRLNCFIVEGFRGGIPKAGDEWQGMKVEHVQRVPPRILNTARDEYRLLWNRINGPESWGANPWVWCMEFRRVEGGSL